MLIRKCWFTNLLILGIDEFFWKAGGSRKRDIDFYIVHAGTLTHFYGWFKKISLFYGEKKKSRLQNPDAPSSNENEAILIKL